MFKPCSWNWCGRYWKTHWMLFTGRLLRGLGLSARGYYNSNCRYTIIEKFVSCSFYCFQLDGSRMLSRRRFRDISGLTSGGRLLKKSMCIAVNQTLPSKLRRHKKQPESNPLIHNCDLKSWRNKSQKLRGQFSKPPFCCISEIVFFNIWILWWFLSWARDLICTFEFVEKELEVFRKRGISLPRGFYFLQTLKSCKNKDFTFCYF